ncbi:MAG: flagellar FliJ family protein [Proteobacteria bacterium]|nr:flagellar FliJ family protein [Pseudomonadota bacterium]
MTTARLLRNAQQVLERHEQRHAQALVECERQVRQNLLKLSELERYLETYLHDFEQHVQAGIDAARARSYQSFIARVAQAIAEQQQVLARARTAQAEELRRWRDAARRSAAVDHLVRRGAEAAQRRAEKAEQAAADRHAQRLWALKGTRRGS